MINQILTFLYLLGVSGTIHTASASVQGLLVPRSKNYVQFRKYFGQQLKHVKSGMTENQVLSLLGKPGYIGHFDFERNKTVWFYGCEGPRKLPTLATVLFDEKSQVSDTPIGTPDGIWSPPSESIISEVELRQTLVLLDQAPPLDQTNPGALIRVVNRLLPLGKTKVLAAFKEYSRVLWSSIRPDTSLDWKESESLASHPVEFLYATSTHWHYQTENLLMLMRVLFDIPGPHKRGVPQTEPMPPVRIGLLFMPPPYDRKLSPRFPMLLVDDIPLLQFSGVGGSGIPEGVMSQAPFFEKYGRLRTRPLHPTDHPWEALAHLENSPQWLLGHRYRVPNGYGSLDPETGEAYFEASDRDRESMRASIKDQILKLLAPVYPSVLKIASTGNPRFPRVDADTEQWDAVMNDLKQHPIRWNPVTNQYERIYTPRQ